MHQQKKVNLKWPQGHSCKLDENFNLHKPYDSNPSHDLTERSRCWSRRLSKSDTIGRSLKKIEDKIRSLAFCAGLDFCKQTWSCNLWQLFEGPSQSEEPGNVGALRVIHTWAPCPCTRKQQCAGSVAYSSNERIRSDKEPASHLRGKWTGARWRTWPCSTSSGWPRFLPARSRLSQCPLLDLCHHAKGMTTLFGQPRGIKHNSSVICATMTAPVLALSCDVTPTSKVAKTGEWSLEKMSSVQPSAKTNPLYIIKETCSVSHQWNINISMFLRSTEKHFTRRKRNN